jgi:hypothetical protein
VRFAEAVDQMNEQGGEPGESEQKSNEDEVHDVLSHG